MYLTVVISLKLYGSWYLHPAFIYSLYEIPFDCAVNFFQFSFVKMFMIQKSKKKIERYVILYAFPLIRFHMLSLCEINIMFILLFSVSSHNFFTSHNLFFGILYDLAWQTCLSMQVTLFLFYNLIFTKVSSKCIFSSLFLYLLCCALCWFTCSASRTYFIASLDKLIILNVQKFLKLFTDHGFRKRIMLPCNI